MLTTNPPVPLLRSISGRLYAAVGVLCVALLATNAQTIIYSGTVAAGARAVEQESIDAMRAVDGFDELLDRYRRAVTANTDARAQQRPETSAELDEIGPAAGDDSGRVQCEEPARHSCDRAVGRQHGRVGEVGPRGARGGWPG